MLFAYTTTFSLIEWLAVTGFFQGVLILVYILFRVRHWRQASLAITYFLVLTAGFALQFSLRLEDYHQHIRFALWLMWSLMPPLCYLLVLQVVRLIDLPDRRHFLIVLLVPIAMLVSRTGVFASDVCGSDQVLACPRYFDWLYWTGSMAGAVSMLLLFLHKGLFTKLWQSKGGRERYWLVMMLVVANIAVVIINLLRAGENIKAFEADAMLVVLGITFTYLASTTLFRVYPPPVQLEAVSRFKQPDLTEEERAIADKVKKLMEVDKVYQEKTFSRADLAREIGCSENTLSRVVNISFGCSFPKLLNDLRVEDAKNLLKNPNIAIQVVASEAGFNSVASFNRVFREITGETPSGYRAYMLLQQRTDS